MQLFSALLSGLIFGLGLLISGMANPAKVLGFLDLAGNWDPSLAFVMGGAILVGIVAFTIARRRGKSLLGNVMQLPTSKKIDRRLIWGSVTFGIGWGLAGYCPGPALVSLSTFAAKPWLFVSAMLAGMLIFEWIENWRKR